MKNEAIKLIEKIGAQKLSASLGVSIYAVNNARQRGLPSSWYGAMLVYCQQKGIECPLSAFNFKEAANEA